LADTSRGIVRVNRKFARGYDAKFAKDSEVVVVLNDNTAMAAEVRQMIGRSSRKQGEHKAVIMMLDEKAVTADILWREVLARTAQFHNDAFYNLEELYRLSSCKDYLLD
jgi:Rad3-related DNA helicase